MFQSAITAGEGTVSGSGFWGGGFAEDEELDECANEYYNRQLAEKKTLGEGQTSRWSVKSRLQV